jgi:hypothetical protein
VDGSGLWVQVAPPGELTGAPGAGQAGNAARLASLMQAVRTGAHLPLLHKGMHYAGSSALEVV